MDSITYKISDLGKIVGGGTPSTLENDYWNGDIPWISPKDLTNYTSVYISRGEKSITEKGYKKSSSVILPKNTVLLSSRAPIGYLAIAANEICTNQGFKSIICDTTKVDFLYLYYFLKLNITQLRNFASGATFPELSGSRLGKIKISIAKDILVQRKIATVTYHYDEQIQNNEKRIQIIQSISKEIFYEWFVRFRFPNFANDKIVLSKIGIIPSSYALKSMNCLIDYYVGGGWGDDDPSDLFPVEASVIRGADFPYVSNGDVSTCPKRFHKVSNYEPRQLKENDIVFEISGGTEEQPVGRSVIVTKGILEQLSNKAICASFCKLIRPDYKKVTPYFFYYWLQYLYDTRIIDRYQLQSTGITNFQFEYFLRKGFCLVPPFELMEKFDSIVGPMRKEIDDLSMMNANLKKQRDMLLPRLMSGKLDVSGKEIV